MAGKTVADREKTRAIGQALKGMFKALQSRPVPDRLRSVVDQLDEGQPESKRKAG